MNLAYLVLEKSKKPTLIAIHHPPMVTGISIVDLLKEDWFSDLQTVIGKHPVVQLVICGHAHTTLTGKLAHAPVYVASSSAYQLVAQRGLDNAPVFLPKTTSAVLHEWDGTAFLSGPQAWPLNADEKRVDVLSGMDLESLKKAWRGDKEKELKSK